jgi:glycine dehydrogenase
MIAIGAEIDAVGRGEVAPHESVLRHAPHPADDVVADDWSRHYSREQAAFPVPHLRSHKYWPPVSRIDGGYGDRNLMCACPPPETTS